MRNCVCARCGLSSSAQCALFTLCINTNECVRIEIDVTWCKWEPNSTTSASASRFSFCSNDCTMIVSKFGVKFENILRIFRFDLHRNCEADRVVWLAHDCYPTELILGSISNDIERWIFVVLARFWVLNRSLLWKKGIDKAGIIILIEKVRSYFRVVIVQVKMLSFSPFSWNYTVRNGISQESKEKGKNNKIRAMYVGVQKM